MKLLTALFGTSRDREVKKLRPILDAVRGLEPRYVAMSDDLLRAQTGVLKGRLATGESLDDILPDAFSLVREATKRVIGMRPFDVQIIGGTVLHSGKISEMVTGEGKTLVAILPSYLNALTGQGVHVVTVNDYLARRDSEWMQPVFEFLGLTIGLIQHDMAPPERRVGYRADVTYGTNNEFGFDYLRDNMARNAGECVQRPLNYAIVDEVDSILIDEARTPLIISGRPEKSPEVLIKVNDVVRQLREETHFTKDEKQRHIILSDEGMEFCERLMGVDDLYTNDSIGLVHMIEQSLKAHNFFKRDKDYMVRDGEVLIVDEFTGRVMEGRRYSDGLHQALEAKERVPLRFESQTVASITYQNYFRLYNKLSGMTGTAATEASEFAKVYNLDVIQIPTNLPLVREDLTDLIFATERGKFVYLAKQIREIRETGRPILVGTVSIEKSEALSDLLREEGIEDFQVLNAKHHEREAAIVANAGKRGAITIATNMAGRGTDIKLAEGIRELGGLYILGTERHESRRIDNQLRGRAGRQGDPGTTRFYVSLEDEVSRLFGGPGIRRLIATLGGEEIDAEPLSQRMVSRSIERAQRQVEEHNFEIRKHVLQYDEVMDRQRKYIYAMRRAVLEDQDITARLEEFFENLVQDAIDAYAPENVQPEEWDLDGMAANLGKTFNFDIDPEEDGPEGPKPLLETLLDQIKAEYKRREVEMAGTIRKNVEARSEGGDIGQIDFAQIARRQFHTWELMALLRAVDDRWIQHLQDMDYLRESVRLRAFGQKDPLLEFKQEGFELFQEMIRGVEENTVQTIFRLTDPEFWRKHEQNMRQGQTAPDETTNRLAEYQYVGADKTADQSFAAFDTGRFTLAGQRPGGAAPVARAADGAHQAQQADERPRRAPVRVEVTAKPNDPCPCGSGKKYKKCCGRLGD